MTTVQTEAIRLSVDPCESLNALLETGKIFAVVWSGAGWLNADSFRMLDRVWIECYCGSMRMVMRREWPILLYVK